MSENTSPAPHVVIEGNRLGLLGFTREGIGNPADAQLYICDRRGRMAVVKLTRESVNELEAWLGTLQDAWDTQGGAPRPARAPQAAQDAATTPAPQEGRLRRVVGAVTLWPVVDRWWSRSSGITRAAVVGACVVGLILAGVLGR